MNARNTAGVRTTRRKKRVSRDAATGKKIEELLRGKTTRKTARTRVAKKQTSRKATVRARAKTKRRT